MLSVLAGELTVAEAARREQRLEAEVACPLCQPDVRQIELLIH